MFFLNLSGLAVSLLIGFMNGFKGKRHFVAPVIYVFLVVFTMQAIRDINDPLKGSVKPSYSINEELLKSIEMLE